MTYALKALIITASFISLMLIGAGMTSDDDYIQGEIGTATSTHAEPDSIEIDEQVEKKIYPSRKEEAKAAYDNVIANHGTGDREEWLLALEWCESRGEPGAVNEEDLDGTPSYGLLQFKPGTFSDFSKAYGIEGELMDPDAQRAIVRRMMDDPSVRWEKQFPWCTQKYLGYPPGGVLP